MDPRPIKDYPGYRITEAGVAETCKKFRGNGYGKQPDFLLTDEWRPLTPDFDKKGRPRYTLCRNNKPRKFLASRLVLEAYVGPCPPGMEACHWDGNHANNCRTNLRWDTHQENMKDCERHGTIKKGEAHHKAKLSAAKVRRIRRIGYPLRPHAVRYNVSEALVSMVLRGEIWKHI